MIINENSIGIYFPDDISDEQRLLYVKNIIDYLHFTDPLHYYLAFGYSDGNSNLRPYYDRYPELSDHDGFIKLKDEDVKDYKLIYDILFNYQIGCLYINTYDDLDKKYNFSHFRCNSSIFEGYVITEMRDYIVSIEKDWDLPAWDTEKMGIPEELIIKDKSPYKQVSLFELIFSIVKSIFKGFKKK